MRNCIDSKIPTHPFVVCNIEGVNVQALVDTGSMKSFISKDIHTIIDFDNSRVDKSEERCNSITGDSLHIFGNITANFKFPSSRYTYSNNFIISSNIQFDCVLGWDFLVNNKLDLRREMAVGGISSYLLKGPHGKTSVCAKSPSGPSNRANLSGVIEVSENHMSKPPGDSEFGMAEDSSLLFQSRYKAHIEVCLIKDVIIPAKTEFVVEGKLIKTTSAEVGMITPNLSRPQESGIHISHVVVNPKGRIVPVRIMNSSVESIELSSGRKVAEFHQLVKSKPRTEVLVDRKRNIVCGVACSTDVNFEKQVQESISPHLNQNDRIKLTQLLHEFADIFDDKLSKCNVTSHRINTGDNNPVKHRPRRLPYAYREESERQIKEMLEQGIIKPSTSPWSSPIVLVKKKNGELRFCVDYRKLNQITVNDAHPLPRIADLLDSVKDATYFTTLDLRSGYWQIPVAPEDRLKTAFVTQNGLYEFTRMPFGLKTAPATFQRAMEVILAGLTFDICLCYLDDVIVFGRNLAEHNHRLETILTRFREHDMRVKLTKCVFASPQVTYLGHSISQQGVTPDPSKVAAVQQIPSPCSVKEVRSFLGLTGYYRRFIPNYATLSQPLTKLTTKEYCNNFKWTDDCNAAFQKLKTLLCSAPLLRYPNFHREFVLQTDASDVGVGAVLSQYDDLGVEHVVAYASKTLSPRERNYSTTEKEAFAIQFGTQHFRVYLLGRKFLIVTDHNALTWLHTMEPKGRIARWLMDLQEFDFEVKHRPGRLHNNADALSRLAPMPEIVRKLQKDAIETCAITLNPSINIRDAQENDPTLAKLRKLKLNNEPKPNPRQFSADPHLRQMLRHYDKLFIRDGILVRALGKRSSHPNYVIVIPKSLVTTCVKSMHDNPFAGHMGISRTEDRIRQRFYWPGIRAAVEEFIHDCTTCAQRKAPSQNNKAPLQRIEVGEPFTFWAMDYMGPLPETARGNRYILVLMDHFSKWCEAFPTKDQKATTVANLLLNKVFSRFGPPVVLHSDQGANFESNLMHELCDIMGIAKTRTTAYHPQCDGQVERQNRTLQDMLSAFVSDHGDDWDEWVDPVVFAYNTSRQESIGYSPYEVIFGRVPRMPLELELGVPLHNPAKHTEYTRSTRRIINDIREIARNNLVKAREGQAKQTTERLGSWKPFSSGQAVWLKRPKKWKFGPKWIGPYTILHRLGVNYKLKSKEGKVSIVHHDNLKLSHIPCGNGRVVPQTSESGDFQVVDTLLDQRNFGSDEMPRTNNNLPRVRPARLRQNVQPPARYGVN